MSRASVCGSASASPIECTGPTGTPAASSAAIHSAFVRVAEHVVHDARQRGEVRHARRIGREARVVAPFRMAEHAPIRSQFAWFAPPMLIQPSRRAKRLVGRRQQMRRAGRARRLRRSRNRSPPASTSAGAPASISDVSTTWPCPVLSWCDVAPRDADRGEDARIDVGRPDCPSSPAAARLAGDRTSGPRSPAR